VSWTVATHPDAEMVNCMLDMATTTLRDGEYPIVHSDYTEEKTMPKSSETLCSYCV